VEAGSGGNQHYPSIAEAIGALIQMNVDVIWTSANLKLYDAAAVRALLFTALKSKTRVGFRRRLVAGGRADRRGC